jgi:glycosidase
LNRFYIGRFEGSFATGVPFNYNPVNQDMRITGTAASLAGLEQGLRLGNALYIEHALKRLLLIHSVIISAGGIPLIYLGDEIATLNDYSYEQDAAKREDSRWIHRPRFDWERAADRNNPDTPQGWLHTHLAHLIGLRKQTPAFANGRTQFVDAWNEHVFGYVRGDQILVLANFAESDQLVRHTVIQQALGASGDAVDMVTGETLNLTGGLVLGAYQFRWLKREG